MNYSNSAFFDSILYCSKICIWVVDIIKKIDKKKWIIESFLAEKENNFSILNVKLADNLNSKDDVSVSSLKSSKKIAQILVL
jgi:hypothetical protein